MSLQNDLDELRESNIIDAETESRIRAYYAAQKNNSTSRLLVVFSLLGALLVGLGITLIVAHNWDNLSKSSQTTLAFLPLLAAQLMAGLALFKFKTKGWLEASGVLVFLTIASTISLISQIYHIPGNLTGFIWIWMLLGVPLIYLTKSHFTSLLYWAGITYFALESGYWSHTEGYSPQWYWVFVLGGLPHYLQLLRTSPNSNFTAFHNWVIPLSLTCSLGILHANDEAFLFITYILLFGSFMVFRQLFIGSSIKQGYGFLGYVGATVVLIITSFSDVCKSIGSDLSKGLPAISSLEIVGVLAVLTLFILLLVFAWRQHQFSALPKSTFLSFLFIPLFFITAYTTKAFLAVNLLILLVGVESIYRGANQLKLSTLNMGLLTVVALITARFLDSDFSFVIRGLIFVVVGIGFFVANYMLISKRKSHA